jgi:hypothetical protein
MSRLCEGQLKHEAKRVVLCLEAEARHFEHYSSLELLMILLQPTGHA